MVVGADLLKGDDMEIVVNKCYGGFGLSPRAIKRVAEMQGKECYFFRDTFNPRGCELVTIEQAESDGFFSAFTVPNPDEFLAGKEWHEMTLEEKQASNEKYSSVSLNGLFRDYDKRSDPTLICVVKELGTEAASSKLARLEIVDIPEGIEWDIDDYDGIETIREKHLSW